jgi:hypothetical protein
MSNEKMQAFKAELQIKMSRLLDEFAEGKLNRDQFHAIYERYNAQMELADQSLGGDSVNLNAEEGGTILLRNRYMGKAQGLIIFDIRTGNIIETLGRVEVAMTEIAPTIGYFTEELMVGRVVERVVKQVSENEWLLFLVGEFTSVVTLFQNEPSSYQTVTMQRMHTEFENANRALFLRRMPISADQMVFPFLSFVQRSMGR